MPQMARPSTNHNGYNTCKTNSTSSATTLPCPTIPPPPPPRCPTKEGPRGLQPVYHTQYLSWKVYLYIRDPISLKRPQWNPTTTSTPSCRVETTSGEAFAHSFLRSLHHPVLGRKPPLLLRNLSVVFLVLFGKSAKEPVAETLK